MFRLHSKNVCGSPNKPSCVSSIESMCAAGSGDDEPCCTSCRFTNDDDCASPAGIREREPREEPVPTAGSVETAETVEPREPRGPVAIGGSVETVETVVPVAIGGSVETVETVVPEGIVETVETVVPEGMVGRAGRVGIVETVETVEPVWSAGRPGPAGLAGKMAVRGTWWVVEFRWREAWCAEPAEDTEWCGDVEISGRSGSGAALAPLAPLAPWTPWVGSVGSEAVETDLAWGPNLSAAARSKMERVEGSVPLDLR